MKINHEKDCKSTKPFWFILLAGIIFMAGCNKVPLTIEDDGNGVTDPSGMVRVTLNKATPITATPGTGYTFGSWAIVSGTGVTIDNATSADTSVTLAETAAAIRADFIKQFTLTVNSGANGSTLPTGSVTVDNGTATSISATPDTGAVFSGWTIVSGTGVTIDNATAADTSVTLTETDAVISASFTSQYTLTVIVDGEGTTLPAGIVTVDNGTATSLSATPDTGWLFSGWTIVSGTGVTIDDDNSTNTSVTLTETNAVIRADFIRIPKLYVPNYDDDTVSVIDGLTGDIDDTIDASTYSNPAVAGVNPDTGKIYVVHEDANISIINGSTNTVSKTIFSDDADYPSVAVNPDTNTIFAASQYETDILVIDGDNDTLKGTFYNDYTDYDGTYPIGMAINPATDRLYILDSGDSVVYVYDGSTYAYISETAPILNDYIGVSIGVNSSTNRVYVPEWNTDSLKVINGSTDAITTTVSVGAEPRSAAVNTATNMIYVTNQADDTVSVINGATNTVSTTISVGDEPIGIAVSESFNMIYVVNSADNSTSIIDGSTNTVTDTVTVGANPQFIGVLE